MGFGRAYDPLFRHWMDTFDIMMETDDIIDLSSYEKGIEILKSKYNVEF